MRLTRPGGASQQVADGFEEERTQIDEAAELMGCQTFDGSEGLKIDF